MDLVPRQALKVHLPTTLPHCSLDLSSASTRGKMYNWHDGNLHTLCENGLCSLFHILHSTRIHNMGAKNRSQSTKLNGLGRRDVKTILFKTGNTKSHLWRFYQRSFKVCMSCLYKCSSIIFTQKIWLGCEQTQVPQA